MSLREVPWLWLARTHIGTTEIPGRQHNSRIVAWWQQIRASFRDDETPWCAAFVGAMLEQCNIRSTRSAAARSYVNWGVELDEPRLGAIVVYSRPGSPTSGHVGFAVGIDPAGNILTLGGNQGNTVSIKPFVPARLLGYRWPESWMNAIAANAVPLLPKLTVLGTPSQNEA